MDYLGKSSKTWTPAKTEKELEMEAHPGMIKYGEHWYKKNEVVINPIDRFADEFNETVAEAEWIGREVGWWYDEAYDLGRLYYMTI